MGCTFLRFVTFFHVRTLNMYIGSVALSPLTCLHICHVVITHCHYPIFSLTRGPWPLPNLVLHRVRSSASSFNFQYPLVSWRSSSSCLRLLSFLPVPSIFPSVTCLEVSPNARCDQSSQPSFCVLYVEYFSPPWPYVIILNISHDWSSWSSPSFSSTTFQIFLVCYPL